MTAFKFPKPVSVSDLNHMGKNSILEQIGIQITEVTDCEVIGTMPVDHRTHQVFGILHGGASVVLAETLGSIGAALMVDQSQFTCVGLEVNANHLRSVSTGIVTGRATPLHVGRTTQVWEIKIHTEDHKLVCTSRLTVGVVPKK